MAPAEPELRGGSEGEEPSTSTCVPCGAALGATWDPSLVERIGALIGRQARVKACRVLLAPTVNLHRSPLGGRNFESYSEDPLLAGRMGAAYVRGAQSAGVACTVKHFAGNEYENDRMVSDSIIDERALRELHLLPFESVVREGGALGIMTSYNRLNGGYCPDNRQLLQDLLRDEWGFDGFVVTDWYGFADTTKAITAGLDLEMPGPGRAYGPTLATAVRDGLVDEGLVDAAVLRFLSVMDRIGALDDEPDQEPGSEDRPEDRVLARQAAVSATVLLKNTGVLPLVPTELRRIAVIGPNAGRAVIMGGGSSTVAAHYLRSPVEALRDRLGENIEIDHEPAVDISRTGPEVPAGWLHVDGTPGMTVEYYRIDDLGGEVVHRTTSETGAVVWFGATPRQVGPTFAWRAFADLTVGVAGRWTISLVQTDPARLLIDDRIVLDGFIDPPGPGHDFFGLAKEEATVSLDLSPDRPVRIEMQSEVQGPAVVTGAKIGIRPAPAVDGIERAVSAAERADAVVLVVGTDENWETEGADRESLHLPGRQDELVRRVLDVAPHAVVVLNAGAPVATPWAGAAGAIVQCWFGGQEMSDGLVDVLFGDADPGGGSRPRCRSAWRTPPPGVMRSRRADGSATAKASSSATAGTNRGGSSRRSPSATACRTPASTSAHRSCRRRRSNRERASGSGFRSPTWAIAWAPRSCRSTWLRSTRERSGHRRSSKGSPKWPSIPGSRRPSTSSSAIGRSPAGPHPIRRCGDWRTSWRGMRFWTRQPERVDERGWIMDQGDHRLHVGRSSTDITHVVPVRVTTGGPLS